MTHTQPSLQITGPWLTHPATQGVLGLLEDAGHSAYLVGGTVRNALMGLPVTDLDAATDALPARVTELAEARGLKVIPTGIEHGTVTILVDAEPVEVTTFRRDVATDGRRAVVAFTSDISEDARRRDFTMNALYVDRSGTVVDPLEGLQDVLSRRIRFIEDPDRRIQEDHLRTLRFFRFSARYADRTVEPDPDALAAIMRNLDGLSSLSGERIGSEILKILATPDPTHVVEIMASAGVLDRVLPQAETSRLADLVRAEKSLGITADPLRRLVAMNFVTGDLLRLSRSDCKRLLRLFEHAKSVTDPREIAWREGVCTARDVIALRAAAGETPPASDRDLERAEAATFPVSARDLMPRFTGPALGLELQRLQRAWIASDFTLDATALLKTPHTRTSQ